MRRSQSRRGAACNAPLMPLLFCFAAPLSRYLYGLGMRRCPAVASRCVNAFVVSSERERRKELEGGGQAPHTPPFFSFFFFSFLLRVSVQDQKEEEEKRGDLACRTTTRTSGRAPRRRNKGREERVRRRRWRSLDGEVATRVPEGCTLEFTVAPRVFSPTTRGRPEPNRARGSCVGVHQLGPHQSTP